MRERKGKGLDLRVSEGREGHNKKGKNKEKMDEIKKHGVM